METTIIDFSGAEQMDSDGFSIVVPAFPMVGVISSRNVRCSQDFGNSSPSRVTCRLTSDSVPLPGNKKAFGAVGWTSSFRYFVQNVRRRKKKTWKKEEESFSFPSDGSGGVFGQRSDRWKWWGWGGGQEGSGSAVQRLAFCIVGQLGIKVLCAAE